MYPPLHVNVVQPTTRISDISFPGDEKEKKTRGLTESAAAWADDAASVRLSGTDILQKYIVVRTPEIYRGNDTVVRKCVNLKTGRRFAVKSVPKHRMKLATNLKTEANLLGRVDHPNIAKLYDVYEDGAHLHVVTELCRGGDLYDAVVAACNTEKGGGTWDWLRQAMGRGRGRRRVRKFTEREAADIVRQIVSAVAHCHERHVVHRDLKLENVLLLREPSKKWWASKAEAARTRTEVRIVDFGLGTVHDSLTMVPMSDTVGTKHYVAPEVLECGPDGYDNKCDVWSIGVLTHALLSAMLPVFASRADVGNPIGEAGASAEAGTVASSHVTLQQTAERHVERSGNDDSDDGVEVRFRPEDGWDNISESAKAFVAAALRRDTAIRPSAAELAEHEWICANGNKYSSEIGSASLNAGIKGSSSHRQQQRRLTASLSSSSSWSLRRKVFAR